MISADVKANKNKKDKKDQLAVYLINFMRSTFKT